MRDPMLAAFAKEMLKMSDKDIEKVSPEQEQDFKNAMVNFAKYRLVAEVVKARYCARRRAGGTKARPQRRAD